MRAAQARVCRTDPSSTLVCITRAPATQASPSTVLQYFSISNVFWFDFPAPGNKKRSNKAQNDYEMMNSTLSAKTDTLPSCHDTREAKIDILDEQNVTKQLPETQAQKQKQFNLPPLDG